MRTIAFLALVASTLAQKLGTFETFADRACSEGAVEIPVDDERSGGELLPEDVTALKSHLADCIRKFYVFPLPFLSQVPRKFWEKREGGK